jgi:hypothetical protein
MEDNWAQIYESPHRIEVEILKGMLAEHDIEAVILDKKDSVYHFGSVQLYVRVEQAFEARQLIEKHAEK